MSGHCNGPDEEVDVDVDEDPPYDDGEDECGLGPSDFDPAYADRAAADWLADRLEGPRS